MSRLFNQLIRLFSILSILLLFASCSVVTEFLNNLEKGKSTQTESFADSTDDFYKVIGQINGTDIKNLRKLINDGQITKLDLSKAVIVAGGDAYYHDSDGKHYSSSDGVIGDFMFYECKKLTAVILPSSVTSIGERAFARTGLTSIDIPNNITYLGYDSFAYNSSLESVIVGNKVTSCAHGTFYSCSKLKNTYVKASLPPSSASYLFSSKPTIQVYTQVLDDYKKSAWANFGTIVGGLENLYPDDMDPTLIMSSNLDLYFTDNACTTLKPLYSKMTDQELTDAMSAGGMEDYIIKIALKIKNNDWVDYEKDFRIHEYKAYSDASYWNSKLNSWGGSYMANPTGIYCKEDSPLYVFVNDEIPDDATLYFEGCIDNKLIYGANKGTRLKKGLNVIEGKQDALYYVLYTADTKAQTKKLSEWPTIKIHVEGGTVNGYYDVSLHTDTDYVKILENATYKLFTVKGEESIFNFKTETYRTYWPQTIEKSIRWFDSLTVREKEVIGICDSVASGKRAGEPLYLTGGESFFPVYYNNPNFAIEGESSDAGYANATNYRTSYNSSGCCSKSFDVTRSDFDDWCAAHECGHLNQGPINMEGCGEVSNNLLSNIIRFSDGFTTTSGSAPSAAFKDYANHVPFFTRDIWSMTRMYWQLYLYYHLAQKNTSFYPELFKAFRADPMKHWNDMYQSSLKFVRTVCQVAQEDLTDFFTIWGFFEPCTDLSVDGKTLTVLQEDIDATLAEISKYPKKNRGIIFIEDRVQKVPTTDFLTEAGKVRSSAGSEGQYGNVGQFSDFIGNTCNRSSYTYVQSGSDIALEGNGGVGFEILDENRKIIFASNSFNFTLPESLGNDVVQNLGTKYKLYSVDADGIMHLVSASGNGDESVEVLQAGTLSTVLHSSVIRAKIKGPLNGTDIKYLRKLINERNLIAIDFSEASFVSGGEVYYTLVDKSKGTSTDYSAVSDNKIGEYAFAKCSKLTSVILPSSVTEIGRQAFCNTGLKKVEIPEGVIKLCNDCFGSCSSLEKVTIASTVTTMSQGVFWSCPKITDAYVKPLKPPTLGAYIFGKKPVIHVKAEAVAAYNESKWKDFGEIVGDLE